MHRAPLPRLDTAPDVLAVLEPFCRLKYGDVWHDPSGRHRVACLDATGAAAMREAFSGAAQTAGEALPPATLAVHDPPYNLAAFELRSLDEYIAWCRRWLDVSDALMSADAALYGAKERGRGIAVFAWDGAPSAAPPGTGDPDAAEATEAA